MALTEKDKVNVRRFLGYETLNANMIAIVQTNYAKLEYKLANLSIDEESWLKQQLSLLLDMEEEMYDARDNLSVKVAGEFVQNDQEIPNRRALLKSGIRELARFLGVPSRNTGGGNIIV